MAATEQPGAARLWAAGEVYEPYVGRWSRLVAPRFLAWLGMPPGLRWIDVGCGTGALGEDHRAALRERLRAPLPAAPDGSIRLTARAWAVRGAA